MTNINLELLNNPLSAEIPKDYDNILENPTIKEFLRNHTSEKTDLMQALEAIQAIDSPRIKTFFIEKIACHGHCSFIHLASSKANKDLTDEIKQIEYDLDVSYWASLVQALRVRDTIICDSISLKRFTGDSHGWVVENALPFNAENIVYLFDKINKQYELSKFAHRVMQVKDKLVFQRYKNGNLVISHVEEDDTCSYNSISDWASIITKDNDTKCGIHPYKDFNYWAMLLIKEVNENWIEKLGTVSISKPEAFELLGAYGKYKNSKPYSGAYVLKLNNLLANKFIELTGLEIPVN